MEIRVTCGGSLVKIGSLKGFQGGLKLLTVEAREKLKRSILKYGFSFPVFTWRGFILDGHQRLEALKALIREGNTIQGVPVVEIKAKSKAEAAGKLLVINSRYGRITDDGLSAFLLENDIDFDSMLGEIEIPDFDVDMEIGGNQSDFTGESDLLKRRDKEENQDQHGDSGKVTIKSFPAFLGSFCLHQAKEEGFKRLKDWKKNPESDPGFQSEMVSDFARAILSRKNHFDFISVPPPNGKRAGGYEGYPIGVVAREVSGMVGIQYREIFTPRKKKTGHGVGARTHRENEEFILKDDFKETGGCCLILDDVSTTRWTVKECQRVLSARRFGCIALVFCYWGNV
jgi:hypothetical protein